jgi:hypothetical protein
MNTMSPGWMMRSEKLRQSGNAVEIFHQVGRHLVLGDAGPQELHAFPVGGVADRADDAHAFLLVLVLDRARLHHRGHAVGPFDLLVLEDVDHVDVDEIDAELLAGDAVALHLVEDRVGEFLHLLLRGRAGGALDPGIGVADVLLRQPRRVPPDLEAEVALLEQHRRAVAAQERVAQAGLEPVPAGRERAGEVAHVLVVHAEHGAELVLLHVLARALGAVVAHPLPVDALLPIQPGDAEICRSHGSSRDAAARSAVAVG